MPIYSVDYWYEDDTDTLTRLEDMDILTQYQEEYTRQQLNDLY